MNIVFFLGNGFDLNMNLKTSYAAFLENYFGENQNSEDEAIQMFLKIIQENNNDVWSDVELALGKCTNSFNLPQDYKKCYSSMLKSLKTYLRNVEAGLPREVFDSEILGTFSKALLSFSKGLRRTDRERIDTIIKKIPDGQSFYVLNFNYTHFVDYLLQINEELVKQRQNVFGSRIYKNAKYSNSWVKHIHVHGDIDGDIIFGVGNENQITNMSAIENEYFKNQIIKSGADTYIGKEYDSDAYKILKNANVVYLYGVSLGETDNVWWERINDLLNANPDCILIIHSHELQNDNVKEELLSDREMKKDMLKNRILKCSGNNTDEISVRMKNQIYIDTTNIFEEFGKIVQKKLDSYWSKQLTNKTVEK